MEISVTRTRRTCSRRVTQHESTISPLKATGSILTSALVSNCPSLGQLEQLGG